MAVNTPTDIPAFTALSFNLNGAVSDPNRKLKWIYNNFVKNKKVDIILFQEVRFSNMADVRRAFWPYTGVLRGLSMNPNGKSRGVVAWIPGDSSLKGLVSDVAVDTDGRWGLMKITAQTESVHILNIYAPSKDVASRELFFNNLGDRFDECDNLIAAGDWNFVVRDIDNLNINGPHPPDPHPNSETWLENLELVDTFAHEFPDAVTSTFRHRNASLCCWKRLDRFYAHFSLLDRISHCDSLSCPHVSDHDPVIMRYGVAPPPPAAHAVYRMSNSLIKQLGIHDSKVMKHTTETLTKYAAMLPSPPPGLDPNSIWDCCKCELIAYFAECDRRATQRRRDKRNRAEELAKWGDCTALPASLAAFNSAFEVRQRGERLLKEIAQQDSDDARIRSRFNWIREGEHSNKLFFNSVRVAQSHMYIPDIIYADRKSTNHNEKCDLIKESFTETFTKRTPDPHALTETVQALKASGRGLTSEQRESLAKRLDFNQVAASEVEGTPCWLQKLISSLKLFKSPGPDGIPNEFYYLLRTNPALLALLKAVFKFSIETGKLPATMRHTYYRLLYKKGKFTPEDLSTGRLDGTDTDPADLGNWRPIGLLCCDFKIFSSYMQQALKPHMGTLVSQNQTAFIPGRSIHDNIMLIQQLIHRHTVDKLPGGLMFVDFAHAYDYISQDYIICILEALNFPEIFIAALRLSMTDQLGQVIVNGDLTAPFPILNGGKQGDPLFPLIYIIACEGLFALLEQHPEYQGIPTPNPDIHFQNSGYADDTVLAVGSEQDIVPIEYVLHTFETASGNRVKPLKSFIIWLGPWKPWYRTIYDCATLPNGATARYLGVKIGTNVSQDEHWQSLLQALQCRYLDWHTRGCSIFGRSLIYNSCLASKLWFPVTQIFMSSTYEHKFQLRLNQYFRQGRKRANISYDHRCLTKAMGGLSQLNTHKQIELLRAKWVIKALAGSNHPWLIYWDENTSRLHRQLGLHSPPLCASANWSKIRTGTHKSDVFPMVTAAYKAWHSLGLTAPTSTFAELSPHPLFNNKFIPTSLGVDPPKPITPPDRDTVRLMGHLGHILIAELFVEAMPPPTITFDLLVPASWRWVPKTARQLVDQSELNLPDTVWQSVLNSIPNWVKKVMAPGIESIAESDRGWAATEAPDTDSLTGNIGDIYYFDKGRSPKDPRSWHLYWFQVADDGASLLAQGWDMDPTGWSPDWRSSLLPNLRPIAVSVIDGTPRLLGWADEVLSPMNFTVPTPKPKPMELAIGASYYSLLRLGTPYTALPERPRPAFNSLNKLIRKLDMKPLPKLADWPVTDIDIRQHTLKKRSGPPTVDWAHRFKHIHNCPFLLPKYTQLIYWITTNTLKSGKWLAIIKRPDTPGTCPHCHNPPDPLAPGAPPTKALASVTHMFWQCSFAKEVWAEADQLGHSFWPDYIDFNYHRDITILVHDYNPITLFKLAVVWSLWRYWCEYFYQPDNFNSDRHSLMISELMLMVKDELLFRLTEARAVIQWLQIVQDRRTDGEERKCPEKQFLLVDSQSVKTNPREFNDLDFPLDNHHIKAWLGNNVLCYIRGNKLAFNHSTWYVYKSQLECGPALPHLDTDSDIDPDDIAMPGRSATFLTMDY